MVRVILPFQGKIGNVEFIKAIQSGEHQSFERLYRMYYRKVFAFLRERVPMNVSPEDMLHDVFVRVWENRASLRVDIPVDAQLFVITKRILIDAYRKDARHKKLLSDIQPLQADDLQEGGDSENSMQELQAAINALPEKRRQIFTLSKMEGLTYQEIADAMHISRNTVESQMVKALKFLRKRMSHLPFF